MHTKRRTQCRHTHTHKHTHTHTRTRTRTLGEPLIFRDINMSIYYISETLRRRLAPGAVIIFMQMCGAAVCYLGYYVSSRGEASLSFMTAGGSARRSCSCCRCRRKRRLKHTMGLIPTAAAGRSGHAQRTESNLWSRTSTRPQKVLS